MRKDRKEELKKSLSELEQQLQELKSTNPDAEYQQLEAMIDHFKQLLNGVEQKGYFWKSFLKSILFLIILYLIYVVSVVAVMGFSYSYLNIYDAVHLAYLIPIISVILLVWHYILNAIVNNIFNKHPFLHFLVGNLTGILFIMMINDSFVHLYRNSGVCLMSLIGFFVLTTIGEFYLSRKFLFW